MRAECDYSKLCERESQFPRAGLPSVVKVNFYIKVAKSLI